MKSPEQLQREYYEATAVAYDAMHVHESDEHQRAIDFLVAWLPSLGVRSALDVGAGTGRTLRHFGRKLPGASLVGVEPVHAMLTQGQRRYPDMPRQVVCGSGLSLPFANQAFDCVTEFGVLHHVADPAAVVAEMTRVARRVVALSDENRYGMRGFPGNLLQLAIFKAGAWRPFYRVWTKGKGYQICEEDGLRYSFSVYDCYDQLSAWADEIFVIPTGTRAGSGWMHPLLTSSHALLCAYRRPAA
jgi:ubiquinone/menaquinone biosynthesis C-methylase UbiE